MTRPELQKKIDAITGVKGVPFLSDGEMEEIMSSVDQFVKEHEDNEFQLNQYEANAINHLILSIGPEYDSGDWFHDIPFKYKQWQERKKGGIE